MIPLEPVIFMAKRGVLEVMEFEVSIVKIICNQTDAWQV